MRCVLAMALLVLTVGCASQAPVEPPAPVAQLAAPAASLAFDAPAGGVVPEYVWNRDGRGPEAYVGFDESTITYSFIQTDDRQYLFDKFNDYDRRVYSTRVGVSYR